MWLHDSQFQEKIGKERAQCHAHKKENSLHKHAIQSSIRIHHQINPTSIIHRLMHQHMNKSTNYFLIPRQVPLQGPFFSQVQTPTPGVIKSRFR